MEISDLLVTHASLAQRGQHKIQMDEVSGSMLIFAGFLDFHTMMPILTITVNFGYFVKHSNLQGSITPEHLHVTAG